MTVLYSERFGRVSVKDPQFGAVGDGSTIDTTAIQAAIDWALANGAGEVYFPPQDNVSHYYKVDAPLTFTSISGNRPIALVGAARGGSGTYGSRIRGSVNGFIIDHSFASVGFGYDNLQRISNLNIQNDNTTAGTGAASIISVSRAIIENCRIGGMVGLDIAANSYNPHIRNTDFVGVHAGATVGMACGQSTVEACSFSGWDEALRCYNAGFILTGSRIEVCNTGIIVGKRSDGVTEGMSGFALLGNSFERCNTCIIVNACSGGIIAGNMLSGTIGVFRTLSSITWSGGTATATTSTAHGYSVGAKVLSIESATPSGYSGTNLACTITDATHFTYAISDPGAASASAPGVYSPECQYGIRMLSGTNVLVAGNVLSIQAEVAKIDCGSGSLTNVAFVAQNASGSPGWIMPTDNYKPLVHFIGCDNPSNATTFAEANDFGTLVEGMEINITDCRDADGGTDGTPVPTFGQAVTTGGGTHNVKIRYNGTGWTVMGI